MANVRPNYDPDSPHDISDFLKVIGDLCLDGREGYNTAARLIEEISNNQSGRRLLLNCHRVVSAQLPKTRSDHRVFAIMQWMQKILGMLARGGRVSGG